MIINYFKNISYSLIGILVIEFILTTLNYFNIINSNILKLLSLLTLFIGTFFSGFQTGKESNNKGYLEGVKVGIIFIILLVIFNFLIFNNNLNFKTIILYFILLIISMIASMIGINKKVKE